MKMIVRSALLASVLAFAGQAHAATHILNLTGTVSSGSSASVTSGGIQFDFFSITLSGFSPITLAAGDDVQATITFDTNVVVPSAPLGNYARLFLIDTSYPAVSTTTSGTADFFSGGFPVLSGPSGGGTSTAVVSSFFNPGGSSFSFDTMQTNFTIDSMSAPTLDVDLAVFDYVLRSPAAAAVPEPATWAMMLAGFALIGAAMRRRPRVSVTYA